MMTFEKTFTPITIGSVEIRNRTVVPAMDSGMFEPDGSISQYALDYYGARADGGFGLVIVEITAVQPSGIGMPRQPTIYDDAAIPGMTKLAERIKAGGATAAIQLHHAGRETVMMMAQRQPVAPSPVPCPVNRETPHELTNAEVYQLIDDYVQAAGRAQKAGFDLVEIHAAHGYMGGQFLSGRSNKRIDEFGGSIEGRTTFLRLIREGISELCGPEFPVMVRLSSEENRIGGVEPNEALVQAMLLEAAGYDAIHVSAGTYGSWDTIVPPPDWQRAWNVESTKRVKAAVGVPVIAVGRFNEPHLVELAVANGAADMVALGRPSIADPAFPNKMQAGDIADIVPCISCTQRCMTFNDASTLNEGDWGVSCMFNPWSNNREEMRVSPAETPKRIMVVGAGPAGLEAAHVAAGRGHQVTVFDRGPATRAGGQFLIAAYPPFKQELTRAIRYQLHRCEATGVEFRWETEVTREAVEAEAPDVLIVATGSVPLKPGIPGIDGPRVVSATDVLTGTPVAGKVLVVGAGETGTETAEYCTDYCEHVTLIDMIPAIAPQMYLTVRDSLLRRFKSLPIDVHTNTQVRAFLDDGVAVRTPAGEQVLSGFDHIILAMGTRPAPVFDTEGLDCEVHVVGDAKAARDAVAAIWEGARVAMTV